MKLVEDMHLINVASDKIEEDTAQLEQQQVHVTINAALKSHIKPKLPKRYCSGFAQRNCNCLTRISKAFTTKLKQPLQYKNKQPK